MVTSKELHTLDDWPDWTEKRKGSAAKVISNFLFRIRIDCTLTASVATSICMLIRRVLTSNRNWKHRDEKWTETPKKIDFNPISFSFYFPLWWMIGGDVSAPLGSCASRLDVKLNSFLWCGGRAKRIIYFVDSLLQVVILQSPTTVCHHFDANEFLTVTVWCPDAMRPWCQNQKCFLWWFCQFPWPNRCSRRPNWFYFFFFGCGDGFLLRQRLFAVWMPNVKEKKILLAKNKPNTRRPHFSICLARQVDSE